MAAAATTPLPAPPLAPRPEGVFCACQWTAVVSGVFALLLSLLMVRQHVVLKTQDPLKSPRLIALQEKLLAAPKDEALKEQIRQLDLQLRQRYFRQLAMNRTGGWLLLGAAAVFLLAARQAAVLRRRPPMPALNPQAAEEAARLAKWSRGALAAAGAVVGLALLAVGFTIGTHLPANQADLQNLAGASAGHGAADFASNAEMQANWPRFRGWDGSGVSTLTNVPFTWGAGAGAGIAWKTEVPAPGFNSPIVWGDRVFLSGGDANRREVFCFDARSGALTWRRAIENVPGSPAQTPKVPDMTGYAASTMATDGRRVYVIFANGDLAALTLDGQPVWSKGLGRLKNLYGHASSLLTWQGRLIVQLDQGEDEASNSKLLALDGASGRVVWQEPRPVHASWSTPIVCDVAGKPQIVALGAPWVVAYDAAKGSEVWRADCLNGEVTPAPVFAGGLLLVVSPNEKLIALRPDGQGDVTKTHVAWTGEETMPDVSSPVSNGELVFSVTTPGLLLCLDTRDGKKVWEKELEMDFHASPSLVGGRLLLVSKKGVAIVADAGREFKELGRAAELGEEVHASPAFAPGRMFVRGMKHLFCIGETAETVAKTP